MRKTLYNVYKYITLILYSLKVVNSLVMFLNIFILLPEGLSRRTWLHINIDFLVHIFGKTALMSLDVILYMFTAIRTSVKSRARPILDFRGQFQYQS